MIRTAVGAMAFCLCLQPVAAENAYFHQQGNWVVASTKNACVASNRPFVEMNIFPAAAVRFSQEVGSGDIFLTAFYWPGAFEKGEKTRLTLVKRKGVEVVLPATADTELSVRADRALTRDEMNVLQEEVQLAVRAGEGEPNRLIGVDAAGLGFVLRLLGSCTAFVGVAR